MKKRIIITGGNGQDGIILSKLLLSKNYSVHSFVNKKKINKIPLINYYYISLFNYNLIAKIVKKIKPFAIIHLASKNLAIINNKNMNHSIFYKKNLLVTKNLVKSIIENDKKIKFIFAGSSQMFKKTNGIVKNRSIISRWHKGQNPCSRDPCAPILVGQSAKRLRFPRLYFDMSQP